MLSFWPSLSLLVFFLVIFLECRAIAGRVTLPLGSFMMVFCYGSIGAPLLALLLQQIPIFSDASPWLLGPPIEELAKALPVIVLAFLTRESRRLSIADLTLIGLASGAGFGFVEGNLNALVSGSLPGIQALLALGQQSEGGAVVFAGHAVTTALVGLAAGIGLRFLPPNIYYAWAPSAVAIVWASFDHGVYNWKVLNAADGALPNAHFIVEFLHRLALHGQLATWVLPIGLIVAQLIEAYLCSKAVGVRRDLLLAREWRPWVANEWLVALMRAPLGRAVFAQTFAYFRLRRAYYLAAFETRRDPKDPTLARHARSLEDRLKRERSILFDPAPGTWLLPATVLKAYALQWAWRMRWVLVFAVLVLLLFMLDPGSLPEGLRHILFGDTFAILVVTAGLAFAVWRIILFGRVPPPDPLAAEGTAFASHYTRQLLLGCSLACGLFPSLAVLLGWKALVPGAAFIGGYLPGWIGQGGNLQILLGLGAIGGAVAPDPRPAGEAFRHELAAGEERIKRLGSEIESAPSLELDGFLDSMAKLDAERDAQARRQLALDGCERQASEATIRDPAPVVQAIKDEFDRLANELLEAAAKDLDAMSTLEQDYARAWSEIMHDLDEHDALRRGMSASLRASWQVQNDIGWALRVVEGTDDVLLPAQLTLLPELREIVAAATTARSEIVGAGIERICATAAEYGENDPFDFARTVPAEDEAALLAELKAEPSAEEPKPFGLRAPQPVETAAEEEPEAATDAPEQPEEAATPAPTQHYQEALDQLIEASNRDAGYLETIQHLERADEALQQPVEPEPVEPRPLEPVAEAPDQHEAVTEVPAVVPSGDHHGALEDLIDAIKRDSGYLSFSKDAPAVPAEARGEAKPIEEPVAQAPLAPAVVEPAKSPQPEVASKAIDSEWATAAVPYKKADEQPATPDIEDAAPSAVPNIPEPSQADTPILNAEPVESIEAPAVVVETAASLEPEPTSTEAVAEHVERLVVETPSIAVEIARPAEPEPTRTESVVVLAEPIARPVVETPSIAVEIATPAEPEPTGTEALVVLAEPIARTVIEPPTVVEPVTTEIAKPTEFEAPVQPAQSKASTAQAQPTDHSEIEALAARFAPNAKTNERKSSTESRASFFARLFETALRQTPESTETPARSDTPHENETKPGVAEPLYERALEQLIEKRDESQTPSDEISAPAANWLADFTAQTTDATKAEREDSLLEKIEWPALDLTAPDAPSADNEGAAPSVAVEVAKSAETPSDVVAQSEPEPASIAHEPVDTPAPPPSIDLAETTQDTAPTPVEAVEVAPAAEPHAEAPKAPEGEDAFASKVDRLSYLLEKLERAMQAAPAPQAAMPTQAADAPQQPLQATAPVAPVPVSPEPVAPEPAAATAQPEQPDEPPATPVEEPVVMPDPAPAAAKQLAEEDAAAPVETTETVAEPAPVENAQPVITEPPAEEPRPAAESVPASAPSESLTPSESKHHPDRLSYLLTKLFETVQESSRKPAAPEQAEAQPASASEPVEDPAPVASEPPREATSATVEQQPEPVTPEQTQISAPVLEPAGEPAVESAIVEQQPEPVIAPPEIEVIAPVPEVAPDEAATVASAPATAAADPAPAEAELAPEQQAEEPVQPKIRSRAAPTATFGSRTKAPRASTSLPFLSDVEKSSGSKRAKEPADARSPATTPRRDWKLGNSAGDTVKAKDTDGAKRPENSFRLKTASGALATTDPAATISPAATSNTPSKHYGPRHAGGADHRAQTDAHAQQHAVSLSDALSEFYAKAGTAQPAMYTTDRASFNRIIAAGKLDAPKRRGAPWSISGMSRRGEVAIRLKPGSEQYIEFVPSTEIFGQVPHYYPRGVGKGAFQTHVPAEYLEYFDVASRQWADLRG